MRKALILLLVLTGVSQLGISQITKIESKAIAEYTVAPMGKYMASLKVFEDHSILTFRDARYQHIDEYVSCSLDNKTVEDLYKLLSSKVAKKGDEYHVKTLGDETLYITFNKMLGKTYPTIYLYESKYDTNSSYMASLTHKQMDKLFGKR
ncbi:hypothetical protein [Mangrovimonas futianensis]|uniref:hypothetical protein n=1 Tax=Mangrovimonas futianensis TaxID=2895523 RepID=UPI001E55305D|nr:hypothetical protein [Mangrovimonas futianensis]MCF1421037.1 hypothetical protein [Mangrovimonas futianensis]